MAPFTSLTLRRLRPDDLALETAFVRGLSRQAGYRRLMSWRMPDDDQLRRWVNYDPTREQATAAIEDTAGGPRLIAVARYVVDAVHGDAEIAVVVTDDRQRQGVGSAVLSALIDTARAARIARLVGVTQTDNAPMIALARRLGFRCRLQPGDATSTIVALELAPRIRSPWPPTRDRVSSLAGARHDRI